MADLDFLIGLGGVARSFSNRRALEMAEELRSKALREEAELKRRGVRERLLLEEKISGRSADRQRILEEIKDLDNLVPKAVAEGIVSSDIGQSIITHSGAMDPDERRRILGSLRAGLGEVKGAKKEREESQEQILKERQEARLERGVSLEAARQAEPGILFDQVRGVAILKYPDGRVESAKIPGVEPRSDKETATSKRDEKFIQQEFKDQRRILFEAAKAERLSEMRAVAERGDVVLESQVTFTEEELRDIDARAMELAIANEARMRGVAAPVEGFDQGQNQATEGSAFGPITEEELEEEARKIGLL